MQQTNVDLLSCFCFLFLFFFFFFFLGGGGVYLFSFGLVWFLFWLFCFNCITSLIMDRFDYFFFIHDFQRSMQYSNCVIILKFESVIPNSLNLHSLFV